MTRGRLGSAVLMALCLAVVARADDAGQAGVSPQERQTQVVDAAKAVQRTYLIRIERIDEARKAAKRDKETDRLKQIDESLKRLDVWRDGRIKAMRESLDSAAAKAELDRALERVEADEMPLVQTADVEPAEAAAPAPGAVEVTPAEPAAKAVATASPARRTADPLNLRGRLRYNAGKGNLVIGSARAADVTTGVPVAAGLDDAAPASAPASGTETGKDGQPVKDPADQAGRKSSTTVRRTAKGISITAPNQSGRMNNAVHGKR